MMLRAVGNLVQAALGKLGYRLVRNGFIASSRLGIDLVFDINRLRSNPAFAAHLPSAGVECVFDVGANTGDTALQFAGAFPGATVHSFEPVGATYAQLQARVASHPRIKAHRLALGAHTGELTLNLFDGSVFATAVSRHAMMSTDSSVGQETVPVDTLDAWCATQGITRIDVLKVDAEGFDAEVLHGATELLRQGRIGFVYFEFFRVNDDVPGEEGGCLTPVHRHLASLGYRPVTFYTDYVSTEHTGGIFNALYARWHG